MSFRRDRGRLGASKQESSGEGWQDRIGPEVVHHRQQCVERRRVVKGYGSPSE